MKKILTDYHDVSPWSLESSTGYAAWREAKLDNYSWVLNSPPLLLDGLGDLAESKRSALAARCRKTNLAYYRTEARSPDPDRLRQDLRRFSDALGLRIAERHRSQGDHGIVALTESLGARQEGYIPYSRRAMNWHTDGYYNAPDQQIRAMVLHCVEPARDGGVNQFLDPEIAYIRLRDQNPDFIAALMHPGAMSIPENREADGSLRPVSTGPVFQVGPDGHLAMRYTQRSRSIHWRDDETTTRARQALDEILGGGDPLMLTARLSAGEGVLCNNVLHNRTGFDSDLEAGSKRLLYRIRFHNRVKGS